MALSFSCLLLSFLGGLPLGRLVMMVAGRTAAAAAGSGCGFGGCIREEDADAGGGMRIWNFMFFMGMRGGGCISYRSGCFQE